MGIFLKCNETAEVCDKRQYKEASLSDHFKMKLHLLICRYCRTYHTNNNKLTKFIKSADIKCLSSHKKQLLKDEINREIRN